MKKVLVSALILLLFSIFFSSTVFAAGGKEHGTVGSGFVNQEDPVGPGIQPDWQN